MKAIRKQIRVTCDECGDVIRAWDEGELQRAKMEHIYAAHPIDFVKSLVRAVPKVKQLGAQLGEFLRENMK